MTLGRLGRRGHVKRHQGAPTDEPPAEPAAASSPETASPAKDVPAAAKKPEMPAAEYDGVRRSVFDLLKEKHPDLADPKGKKPAAAPAAPRQAEPAKPVEPPKPFVPPKLA